MYLFEMDPDMGFAAYFAFIFALETGQKSESKTAFRGGKSMRKIWNIFALLLVLLPLPDRV